MKRIDVNVDIGEGFPWDAELLRLATSANICCGEHAGSWELTLATVHACRDAGVRIGMHPGFPDRAGMGRNAPTAGQARAWYASVVAQALRFAAEVPDVGYCKPHGAFYNLIAQGDSHALEAAALIPGRLMLLGDRGQIREGFAERGYTPDGTLVPRSEPGAMLEDLAAIARQAVWLAERVDSICVHGDSDRCVQKLEAVVRALRDAGYEVAHG